MQVIRYKDINKITSEGELQSLLYKLRVALNKLYKDKLSGQLKDTSLLKKARQSIARVLTRLNNIKKNKHA